MAYANFRSLCDRAIQPQSQRDFQPGRVNDCGVTVALTQAVYNYFDAKCVQLNDFIAHLARLIDSAALSRTEKDDAQTLRTTAVTHVKQMKVQSQEMVHDASNNNIMNRVFIDMHGSNPDGAVSRMMTEYFPLLAAIRSRVQFVIICGKGCHSINGDPQVLPAIKRMLDNNKIPWSCDSEGNVTIQFVSMYEAKERKRKSSSPGPDNMCGAPRAKSARW